MGNMILAQAGTLVFQDGFRMVALVLIALVPAWVLGRSRARRLPV